MTRGGDHFNRFWTLRDPPVRGRKTFTDFTPQREAQWSLVSAAFLRWTPWFALDAPQAAFAHKGRIQVRPGRGPDEILVESPDGIGAVCMGSPGSMSSPTPMDYTKPSPKTVTVNVKLFPKDLAGRDAWLRIIDTQGHVRNVYVRDVLPRPAAKPATKSKMPAATEGAAKRKPAALSVSRSAIREAASGRATADAPADTRGDEGTETPMRIPIHMPAEAHPCLYLTPEEVRAARVRARTEPWARPIAEKILRAADKALSSRLDIPHKPGQWAGWYSCKACGTKLVARSPTEHVCPKCGKVYTGGMYDGVYVSHEHSQWCQEALDLALAYVLEPKEAYAARVRKILLEYASFYTELPLHDYRGRTGKKSLARGARLTAQTLDEARLLVLLARAYDLVYDASCLDDADRHAIEADLIRPMVDTIRRNPWGRLNWQSWHNAAIISAGLVLSDAKLVDEAINDPKNGFLFQMRLAC